MSYGYRYRWCSWCCNLHHSLCRQCNLCQECCSCCIPSLVPFCPPPCLPPLPCLGPSPPPYRIVREQVLVPVPFPVYRPVQCFPQSCCYPSSCCEYNSSSCNPFAEPCRPKWPRGKRIYKCSEGIIPGYKGHIPGFKMHSAARTFGQATRDTCSIMSRWNEPSPVELPCRIFEQ